MSGTLLRFLIIRHRLSVGLAALVPIIVGFVVGVAYPSYNQHRVLVESMMESMSFIKDFFAQGEMDLLSASGAFTLPFQHPVVMVTLSIAAAIPMISMLAGDRGRGSLDLLAATPISRGQIIGTLIAAAFVVSPLIMITSFVGAGIGSNMAGVVDEVPWDLYVFIGINQMALTLFLASVALVLSVISNDYASAGLRYGCVVFVFLMTDVAARLDQQHPWLAKCTPFGYHRPGLILSGEGLGKAMILLLGAVAVTAGALVLENRRSSV